MQDMSDGIRDGRFIDRRMRPHNHAALKCPRCDSLNTKFCYYNNYNLSQPRHFCKACRRYWTKGGVLRSVPVGGGCRKKKPKATTKTSCSSSAAQGCDLPGDHQPLINRPSTEGQIFSTEFGMADISYGGVAAEDPMKLDWGSGDQDLLDLTAEVDPSFWINQYSEEWNDHQQPL